MVNLSKLWNKSPSIMKAKFYIAEWLKQIWKIHKIQPFPWRPFISLIKSRYSITQLTCICIMIFLTASSSFNQKLVSKYFLFTRYIIMSFLQLGFLKSFSISNISWILKAFAHSLNKLGPFEFLNARGMTKWPFGTVPYFFLLSAKMF